MNELVFIGQNMNKEAISAALDTCLATNAEIDLIEAGLPMSDNWPL